MEDRTIHPSMKSVVAAYVVAIAIALAGIWAIQQYAQDQPRWLYFIPPLALLVPLKMHLKRRLISLHFHDDHLTLETGFLSRTRRTVDMAKIQDVTVQQTLGQRMMGVGDIVLEDSGQSGSIAIRNLDQPREIADLIINSSKRPRPI
jgi:uncharacterized membrane protein YdbT with pleckstrin-like domain